MIRLLDLILFIIVNSIIAIIITIPLATIHEFLHARKAKQLGCLVVSQNLVKNETVVDTEDPEKIKQIARAPYYYLVPASILILVIGLYMNQLGIIIGGAGFLLMQCVAYPIEGRAEKVKKNELVEDEGKKESSK